MVNLEEKTDKVYVDSTEYIRKFGTSILVGSRIYVAIDGRVETYVAYSIFSLSRLGDYLDQGTHANHVRYTDLLGDNLWATAEGESQLRARLGGANNHKKPELKTRDDLDGEISDPYLRKLVKDIREISKYAGRRRRKR